jgi:uncharacterized protein YdaU (DUF1376 family)
MIWYKFHLGDYLTHTMHLSDAEDLAYRRLLDLYYMSERPIPLDTEAVARKIRLDLDITESVLNEFFERTEVGYRNQRCEYEIGKYKHQVATNTALGKRGGRPKKTESQPNQKRIQTLTEEEKEKTISSQATRFEEFWSLWPSSKRKVGKAAVQAKWQHHHLDKVADLILAHVASMKTSEQWTTGFEPAPMTYINQRRWEDENQAAGAISTRRVI